MFIPQLLVQLVLSMEVNMEVPTRLFYVCFNKLVRKLISHNSLKMSKIKRGFFMVLGTEFIKITTQELKLLKRLLKKCSRLQVNKN